MHDDVTHICASGICQGGDVYYARVLPREVAFILFWMAAQDQCAMWHNEAITDYLSAYQAAPMNCKLIWEQQTFVTVNVTVSFGLYGALWFHAHTRRAQTGIYKNSIGKELGCKKILPGPRANC